MYKFSAFALTAALLISGGSTMASSVHRHHGPYKIHVVTIGAGDELFTRFGHIALMTEDTATGERLVYNFGTFDFEDPRLRIKYARGFLNYWLSVVRFDDFLYFYTESNRDVWIQTLNLDDNAAQEVVNRLRVNARPENKYYAYRHFLDNCCTRVRDVIDDATAGALSARFKKQPVERDFRYWTAKCLDGLPLYRTVILYSLGPAIDKPITRWDEQFLPEVLLEDLEKVTLGKNDAPLVLSSQRILKRDGAAIGAKVPAIDIAVLGGIALCLIVCFTLPLVFGDKTWTRRILGMGLTLWGLLCGLGSLMLWLYWMATTHYDTHYNENLLVHPVTHLWLLGPGLALLFKAQLRPLTQKVISWYFIGALVLVAIDVLLKIGPFIQGNWGTIGLAIAVNAAAFFALRRTGAVSISVPVK